MEHANTLPRDLQIVAIVQRLAVCADAAQVCHALAECTRKLIGADGVTVVMRDHERCRYVEENAIGELWKGQDFAIGECISGWAMLHDEQLAILDIRQDPRIPQSLYAATFVHSLAMTPIGHDPAIGAMGVYWSHEHAATDDELASLRAIADSAALALVNLRLVEELRAANARKEQFLASLAHELGALLGPLRTSLHLQGNASDLDAHRRARDIMTRQVARQARLVDHLLEGSVLLTGLASSTCVPLDLGEEITEAVRAHDAAAQAAEVRLALAPLPDRMPMLGDPARIRQALAQLLDNSVRCTPPGGRIEVSAAIVGANAVVHVVDTGIGISPRTLPHVFEPFSRPAEEPERSLAGLGLGLSMVSAIAAMHGGSATLSSDGPGQGAIATLEFPLRESVRGQAHPRSARGTLH